MNFSNTLSNKLNLCAMHHVFGLGVLAPTQNSADTQVYNVSHWSWNAQINHFLGLYSAGIVLKHKVVDLKKLVFQSGVCFLIQCIFDHGHSHLVDFKGERDPLQQNGLHGQYQFGFIVSKTCCNFLVEFVSSFFPLKWKVNTDSVLNSFKIEWVKIFSWN